MSFELDTLLTGQPLFADPVDLRRRFVRVCHPAGLASSAGTQALAGFDLCPRRSAGKTLETIHSTAAFWSHGLGSRISSVGHIRELLPESDRVSRRILGRRRWN